MRTAPLLVNRYVFRRLACILTGRHQVQVVLYARRDGRVEQRRMCPICGLA